MQKTEVGDEDEEGKRETSGTKRRDTYLSYIIPRSCFSCPSWVSRSVPRTADEVKGAPIPLGRTLEVSWKR